MSRPCCFMFLQMWNLAFPKRTTAQQHSDWLPSAHVRRRVRWENVDEKYSSSDSETETAWGHTRALFQADGNRAALLCTYQPVSDGETLSTPGGPVAD